MQIHFSEAVKKKNHMVWYEKKYIIYLFHISMHILIENMLAWNLE